jgi:sortase A
MTRASGSAPAKRARALRVLQRFCFGAGTILLVIYAVAIGGGELGRRSDISRFAASAYEPDQSLWSRTRIAEFAARRGVPLSEPVALLRIPSLSLVVPLYPDSGELHLARGVGLIEGMAKPGDGGNLGIAGHRDGFFRVLQHITSGAVIDIQTRSRVHRYRVRAIDIVDATDSRPLIDTPDPTVTLVTCYPFYYAGPAPKRFVVRAAYDWSFPHMHNRRSICEC